VHLNTKKINKGDRKSILVLCLSLTCHAKHRLSAPLNFPYESRGERQSATKPNYHYILLGEPEEFSGCDVEEIEQSDSQEVLVKIKEQWKVEYHVVYSESYSVPVLYVNAHHADGSMVHHDELMKLCSSMHKDTITNHLWSTLSQTEHPFIGVPFYMLHPCNTSKLMSSARPEQSKRSYLIQWLSSIGPAVGLNIPSFYCN